jgi:tellurite resistance protein
MKLALGRLERLRDGLRERARRRPSMVLGVAAPHVAEAMHLVEEYGPMCEAMFLVMAADRRVLNIEREVLRGALDVLSQGQVRTAHMEAMLDAAARRLAREGEAARSRAVVAALRDDPVRAEATLVLAAAVATADGRVVPEERAMIAALAEGLDVSQSRLDEILAELTERAEAPSAGAPG